MKFPNNIPFANLAVAWCAFFGLLNVYWILGGNVGVNTLGIGLEAQRFDPVFIRLVWMAVFSKLVAGCLAVMLNWKSYAKLKIILATIFGSVIAAYGIYGLLYSLFMIAGIFQIPDWIGYSAVKWHLFLWSPMWLTGGLFFILAAWSLKKST